MQGDFADPFRRRTLVLPRAGSSSARGEYQPDCNDGVHQRIAGHIDNANSTASDFAHERVAPDQSTDALSPPEALELKG